MKTCICCGTKASVDALTCLNCGEGSWSRLQIVVLVPKDDPVEKPIVIDPNPMEAASATVSEEGSPPVAIEVAPRVPTDPDTKIEVPMKRRGKRPS